MIQVIYNEVGDAMILRAEGHAGYAEKGKDIVCAAVSVLMQTLAYSVDAGNTGNTFELSDGKNGNRLTVQAPMSVLNRDKFDLVVEGLIRLAENYPENVQFKKLCTKSVNVMDLQIDGKGSGLEGSLELFRVERRVPDLDFLTECDNRVWGCSSRENVIYGCKLGDPTNWFSYRGTAADSYAVTVGSDGEFTGAATCMGYALFFKENTLHKLYGSRPADFRLVSVQCRGVAKYASRSLCVIAEVLYYLSNDGVMAWDGSLPVKISGVLDSTWLMNVRGAVGGVLDTRYYLHMRQPSTGETRLLVYDTERQLWHEEDVAGDSEAEGWAMCSTGRQLYQWDGASLWATEPNREADRDTDEAKAALEKNVAFDAVTGDIGLNTPADKYVSRVTLRVDALSYSVVKLQASYDGGAWETLGEAAVLNKYTRVNLPFGPTRHDTMRLRLTGTGQIAVRSVAFTMADSRGNRVAGGEPRN